MPEKYNILSSTLMTFYGFNKASQKSVLISKGSTSLLLLFVNNGRLGLTFSAFA
jgi:hypothetical protein